VSVICVDLEKTMMCESCERQPWVEVVKFDDGEEFYVCEGCMPSEKDDK
jgi:MinD superfamily P-loop ATPase